MIPGSAKTGTAASDLPAAPTRLTWQFRTSSLLWLTFTAAMTLAYARLFGLQAMGLVALTPIAAAVIGAAVGWRAGRMIDAIYWAAISSTLGAVSVIAAPIGGLTFVFWPLLGALVGGYAGAYRPLVTWRSWLASVALGAGIWMVLVPKSIWSYPDLEVDLAIAPIIAVGLAFLIRVIDGLQVRYQTSRDAWAAGLVFAVIAGNLWAASVAGRLGQ